MTIKGRYPGNTFRKVISRSTEGVEISEMLDIELGVDWYVFKVADPEFHVKYFIESE
jgi:hypothetical protein